MVSELQVPEFPEDHGGDGDDLTPKVEPRGSVSFDGGWDSKKELDQENTLGGVRLLKKKVRMTSDSELLMKERR